MALMMGKWNYNKLYISLVVRAMVSRIDNQMNDFFIYHAHHVRYGASTMMRNTSQLKFGT
jgi:hypothetical protein